MNDTNCQDRPLMSSAQTIQCSKLSLFAQSLISVQARSTVCIISCISNFLADSKEEEGSSEVAHRINPVLDEFFRLITDHCRSNPDRIILVCPPLYRRTPNWFRDGMPEILLRFSSSFAKSSLFVKNMLALPGFATPTYDQDGIHLTLYSGYEYVLHLFARAQAALDALESSPESLKQVPTEDVRSLQDRMTATEQDLKRLNSAFETKSVADAELACFR
jgi:hypothetical protein